MDITNQNKSYKSKNSLVYSCQYHVIWTTKFRRPVLTNQMQNRLKEIILENQKNYDYEILEIETMTDHIHLLIDTEPKKGIFRTIKYIKGLTSRILRDEFKELKSRLPCLWTRSKFISTVGSVSLETVKKYIEDQKNV